MGSSQKGGSPKAGELRQPEQPEAIADRTDRLQRVESTVAVLATAVAVLLFLTFFRHAGALWRDEVNSVNVAMTPSFSGMWRQLEFESFPLLWPLLLRGWLVVGSASGDSGLRLLGLLGGLAVPGAVWFAALRLGRRVPLVSLALLAVNPEIVRWSSTVRAWGLGTALAIVTLVLVREATVAPSPRRILRAGLLAVLSVQCVFQNSVLLAASVAGAVAEVVVERQWRRAAVPVGIGMVAAVTLLPYLPTLRRVGEWSVLNQAAVTVRVLAEQAGAVFAASGTVVLACWLALVGVALALAVWWLLSSATGREGDPGNVVLLAVVALVVAVGGLALLFLKLGYPTQPWYYIGLAALIATCGEAAIASCVRSRTLRIAVAGLALVALSAGFLRAWTALQEPQSNMDAVAARVRKEAVRGDLVIVNPWYFAISFDRYYHGDAEVTTIPPLEDRRVHRYDLLKERMVSADPMAPCFPGSSRCSRLASASGSWAASLRPQRRPRPARSLRRRSPGPAGAAAPICGCGRSRPERGSGITPGRRTPFPSRPAADASRARISGSSKAGGREDLLARKRGLARGRGAPCSGRSSRRVCARGALVQGRRSGQLRSLHAQGDFRAAADDREHEAGG